MKLNHINLPVADVAASQAFYEKYFGLRTVLERGRDVFVIMRDEGGLVLNLSSFDKSTEVRCNKDFHVGFFLETREEVLRIYERMIAGGLEAEPPRRMPGRWEFRGQVPGGGVTEAGCPEGDVWQA